MTPRAAVRILAGFAAGLFIAGAARADGVPAAALFSEGNRAYREGRFAEAAERYALAVASGAEDGAVYYNWGNALLKAGRTGEALWAYLRAAEWIPRDPDLKANAAHARSVLSAAETVSIEMPRWLRWLTLGGYWSDGELVSLAGLMLWLASLAWIAWGWLPGWRRAAAAAGGLSALTAGAVLMILIAQTAWREAVPRGVTLRDRLAVRFSPQEDGIVHFSLSEGARVRLLDAAFGWRQIQRADGKAGWIPEEAVHPL